MGIAHHISVRDLTRQATVTPGAWTRPEESTKCEFWVSG
ncbi:hypothetical protein I545_2523 [Mycobacterium kansasii 662]|uniref:Uncharacterized protein n=2 Tax=Mycobacterium kansasii TaxID=1768 RepID=A0A1V3X1M9_MYCKA|nr:hypothetical protein I545_2523 [Mycobacterium kansasii 662]KEP40460.1 hypothetical protein MKSMC1_44140 [Mycobacterium kansasii]OOK63886.1 hypothetical protein BZL29_8410 [Mycobacterium kansasii]OOK72401.1 hypothetical protein BZL30_5295 [Mycobacterium kansasii]